ncbi:MAG: hypothetical protein ACK5DG_07555 [Chitinophagaceae bacterium]
MKKPLLFIFLLLAATVSRSQSFEGTWRGVMIQDSPVIRINFEMVLEQKEGSIMGYLYRLFIVNDSLIYNTVKVTARVSDNVLIVEDDESVSRNFDDRANRKIKAAYFFKLNPKNKNSDTLSGEWTTTRFKNKYMSISGSVTVSREPLYETTQIFKRLEEKQLHRSIAFVPKFTAPDIAVNKTNLPSGTDNSTNQQAKIEPTTNNTQQTTIETKTQPSTVVINQPKQEVANNNQPLKKDSTQTVLINPPKAEIKPQPSTVVVNQPKQEVIKNNQPLKKDSTQTVLINPPKVETKPQPVTIAVNQPKQEVVKNNQPLKKDSTQTVLINPPKVETKPQPVTIAVNQPKQQPQQQKQQPTVTTNQNKPVTPSTNNTTPAPNAVVKNEPKPQVVSEQKTNAATEAPSSIIIKTDAVTLKEPVANIQKPVTTAPVINNPIITTRSTEVIQTLEIVEDSVTLSLYDNGEIDGDVVSVFLNNEKIIENVTLKASAYKKTIYFKKGETVQLTLFAENLGTIPPNTGLLVIYSGEKRFQVFFTSTLNKSSVILMKRE